MTSNGARTPGSHLVPIIPRLLLGAALCVLGACKSNDGAGTSPPADGPMVLRPRSNPIEYVGLMVTRPVDDASFVALVSPLFGADAAAGRFHHDYALQPGVLLTSAADTRTPDQVVIALDMVPVRGAAGERRPVLRVPASLAYGQVFIDTVRVALANANEVRAEDPSEDEPWELEYATQSFNGGRLSLKVTYAQGAAQVVFATENPRTSLARGRVNEPAFSGDPFETLGGTVWFSLSRDQFDFFSHRAYGVTSGAAQNFRDFRLLPHRWLRLTVTPRLEDKSVDVAFEVVTLDDRRLPLAVAPASLVAGEQFQQNVFRLIDNMLAQERAAPGTSTAFKTPFYYDDPEGGGLVIVEAEGIRGQFRIAYVVQSPAHFLSDVDFLGYTHEVPIPDAVEPPSDDCADMGSTTSLEGRFRLTFDASDTVRESMDLTHPLRGRVWGSVFRAVDVTIAGPNPGAQSVADFHFADVDVTSPHGDTAYEIETTLPAGEYQILGFMDIDGNADLADADPDQGDPVLLPIGAYQLHCAMQTVVAEFALLLP